jgi:hypothetical protein
MSPMGNLERDGGASIVIAHGTPVTCPFHLGSYTEWYAESAVFIAI